MQYSSYEMLRHTFIKLFSGELLDHAWGPLAQQRLFAAMQQIFNGQEEPWRVSTDYVIFSHINTEDNTIDYSF